MARNHSPIALTTAQSIQKFRRDAMATVTNRQGVYALCDLDEVPLYVGQSTDGIRARVRRHLTSARSDIIANRQVDPWEVAWVWAFPVESAEHIGPLEAALFAHHDAGKALMNGSILRWSGMLPNLPVPEKTQVLPPAEASRRRDPVQRLPRQVDHIGRLVDHILNVKDSTQLRRSLASHFERLDSYRAAFLAVGEAIVRQPGEAEDDL